MWRFIPFQKYDPYFKTGLNKALIESVEKNQASSTIFLSGWSKNCVNIGYSQKFEKQVNVEEFQNRENTVLVRRQGGGGTTYLTPEGEITWGIVASSEKYPDDVNQIYQQVCTQIAEGLETIGIEAEHEPINDIVTENGKISGATLKQEKNTVYIGGTLLYKVKPEEMFTILTPPEDKKKDKQIQDFKERITSVRRETTASSEKAKEALKKGLLNNKTYKEANIKPKEKQRAEQLAKKYSSKQWLHRK